VAHVLTNLPDQGEVGIVEYRGQTIHYRKRNIEMANTTKIVLRGEAYGPDGPDLRFLRLAVDIPSAGSRRSARSQSSEASLRRVRIPAIARIHGCSRGHDRRANGGSARRAASRAQEGIRGAVLEQHDYPNAFSTASIS
jgi:hypothetical protein